MVTRLWGGRFTGATDPQMEQFNASIGFDRRLWRADIEGSRAYAQALARVDIIADAEAERIVKGLDKMSAEWEDGRFVLDPADEDIHTANERRLTELIGPVAGKLHTGRSRNDQIATDVRIWLRGEIDRLRAYLHQLIGVTVDRAAEEVDLLMPGYTHLQPAQPIRWSHWLLSHAWAWQRDAQRLADVRTHVNVMPLGNGALAGNPFAIDREWLAAELGFASMTQNSLDGVSDRDFIVDFLYWAALTMVHMSRLAEDLIIFSTREFGFVTLADAYSTGSSLMPQKKNPDALELLRGKAGRVSGHLSGLLMTVKGLPSTYNKDLQEDKEPLFDAVDTLSGSLQIATGVISTLSTDASRIRAALQPEMLATDLAEYLVRKGVPFRESHHVAGRAVQLAEQSGMPLSDLELAELVEVHAAFDEDVRDVWDFEASVERRDVAGGTSRRAILAQIAQMRSWLAGQDGSG